MEFKARADLEQSADEEFASAETDTDHRLESAYGMLMVNNNSEKVYYWNLVPRVLTPAFLSKKHRILQFPSQ